MHIDDDTPAVRSWHAHIYFDGAAQRALAAELRERIAGRWALQLGRWHDAPPGPHTRPMYMVAFAPALFDGVVPWLALNRRGLDILLHPNTLAPRADHLQHALWLGQPQPLRAEVLAAAISIDDDEALMINTTPREGAR